MQYTVKQVAQRVALPSRTVRYYDRIGLVSRLSRSPWNFGGGLLSEFSQMAVAATSGAAVVIGV